MTKIVAKVYLRMMVMIVLAHVTGGLVLMDNYWGAVTSALGCVYQMINGLIFIADDPIRITKKIGALFARLGAIVALAFATGYLITSASFIGTAVLAAIGIALTVETARFVHRHDPTRK